MRQKNALKHYCSYLKTMLLLIYYNIGLKFYKIKTENKYRLSFDLVKSFIALWAHSLWVFCCLLYLRWLHSA